jgi:hypothetical protein
MGGGGSHTPKGQNKPAVEVTGKFDLADVIDDTIAIVKFMQGRSGGE